MGRHPHRQGDQSRLHLLADRQVAAKSVDHVQQLPQPDDHLGSPEYTTRNRCWTAITAQRQVRHFRTDRPFLRPIFLVKRNQSTTAGVHDNDVVICRGAANTSPSIAEAIAVRRSLRLSIDYAISLPMNNLPNAAVIPPDKRAEPSISRSVVQITLPFCGSSAFTTPSRLATKTLS